MTYDTPQLSVHDDGNVMNALCLTRLYWEREINGPDGTVITASFARNTLGVQTGSSFLLFVLQGRHKRKAEVLFRQIFVQ